MPAPPDPLQEILIRVIRMEAKLDHLPIAVSDHETRLRTIEAGPRHTRDHDIRITNLERAVWRAAGAAGTLGSALGAAVIAALGVK